MYVMLRYGVREAGVYIYNIPYMCMCVVHTEILQKTHCNKCSDLIKHDYTMDRVETTL